MVVIDQTFNVQMMIKDKGMRMRIRCYRNGMWAILSIENWHVTVHG